MLCVRRDGKVVMAADGQVTLGHEVLKSTARKIRRLYNDKIMAGFAGSTADALTLFERCESKLQEFNGNLRRAAVEMARDWRTDRVLRRLEAMLVVADVENSLLITGVGDVLDAVLLQNVVKWDPIHPGLPSRGPAPMGHDCGESTILIDMLSHEGAAIYS